MVTSYQYFRARRNRDLSLSLSLSLALALSGIFIPLTRGPNRISHETRDLLTVKSFLEERAGRGHGRDTAKERRTCRGTGEGGRECEEKKAGDESRGVTGESWSA